MQEKREAMRAGFSRKISPIAGRVKREILPSGIGFRGAGVQGSGGRKEFFCQNSHSPLYKF